MIFFTHAIKLIELWTTEGFPELTAYNTQSYLAYLLKLVIIYSSAFEQYIERLF